MVESIVAATDGSPAAMAAVTWAADDAARRGTPLRIVNVMDHWPYDTAAFPPPDWAHLAAGTGERILAEWPSYRPGSTTPRPRRPPIGGERHRAGPGDRPHGRQPGDGGRRSLMGGSLGRCENRRRAVKWNEESKKPRTQGDRHEGAGGGGSGRLARMGRRRRGAARLRPEDRSCV
ncbi:universal stress protein [Streptosporangium sp. NPDC048865]|uniref:universal stress protein n=1 Tax=Streptosporangium sp. NPDC048865 TaxID=3155766 RepID=UPI0034473917